MSAALQDRVACWQRNPICAESGPLIADLLAALNGLGGNGGWQPMSTAPKSTSTPCVGGNHVEGKYFLAYCPDETLAPESCICICWWEPHTDGGVWFGEGGYPLRPVLWHPLVAPPAPTLLASIEAVAA